jgi:hypothetical protein
MVEDNVQHATGQELNDDVFELVYDRHVVA